MLKRICIGVLGASAFLVAACSSSSSTSEPPPCTVDKEEPANDQKATATNLGVIRDDDEVIENSNNPPGKIVKKLFSTSASGDVDWYTLQVNDTGLAGNPKISLILGDGHEASAFWSCGNSAKTESVLCGVGTQVKDDPEMGIGSMGCATNTPDPASGVHPQFTMMIECAGTSTDSGTLTVRIKRAVGAAVADACSSYFLTIGAD